MLRLLVGIMACCTFAVGNYFWSNIGAICFVLSNFLDHTDGEFARLTGKMTKVGHYFDLASDAIVNILLFLGIGIGLMHSNLANFALPMGFIAGVSVAAVFHMRMIIEQEQGKAEVRQPHLGVLEIEDILYLLPVVTIIDQLVPFLTLASFGAPIFLLWVLKEFLILNKTHPL